MVLQIFTPRPPSTEGCDLLKWRIVSVPRCFERGTRRNSSASPRATAFSSIHLAGDHTGNRFCHMTVDGRGSNKVHGTSAFANNFIKIVVC